MIVWEEIDEGYLRARAGYNKEGAYHSYDARFYAKVIDLGEAGATYLVEFFDDFRDRETGDLILLFTKNGSKSDIFDAQLMVEAIIYQAMANEAKAELEASEVAYETVLEGSD